MLWAAQRQPVGDREGREQSQQRAQRCQGQGVLERGPPGRQVGVLGQREPGGITTLRRALAQAVDQNDHQRQDEQDEQPEGGGQQEENGEPPGGAIAHGKRVPSRLPYAALNLAMISARFGSVSVAAAPNSSGVSRSWAG